MGICLKLWNLLTGQIESAEQDLPATEAEFKELIRLYFPHIYDIKYLMLFTGTMMMMMMMMMESSSKELKINHFVFRQPDRRSSISGQLSQCWTLWHTAPGDIFILFVVFFCFYAFCLTPSTRCHILLIVVVVVFFGTQHQAICIVCCFCFVLYVFVWQPAPGVIVCLLLLFLLVFDIVAFVFF